MPTVSPLATVTLTCCTAFTMPRRVMNSTVRSCTSSKVVVIGRSSSAALRIDDVAQSIAQQVEAEHRQHQRSAGEERDPPFARDDEARTLGDHDAPFRRRRAHAKPDEGKACGVQ